MSSSSSGQSNAFAAPIRRGVGPLLGVPWRSRGYQASGTRSSSRRRDPRQRFLGHGHRAGAGRGGLSRRNARMPTLNKFFWFSLTILLTLPDLLPVEPAAAVHSNGIEPELRRVIVFFSMDMGRLSPVPGIEEETEAGRAEDGRHQASAFRSTSANGTSAREPKKGVGRRACGG